jgi:DNA (cytosine-5)-methyltransferase 1
MNELALFAGAGGGILGGKLLGWRTVCAVEINAYARSVLLSRQRDGYLAAFPIWDDITTFDGNPWRGRVDVVSGGFPCQDISSAGGGAGIDGERSGLWAEFARIISEVQPAYVLVENSPMLTLRGLDRVLGDLAALGYDASWGVLGSVDAGLPALRERIWIVASSVLWKSYSGANVEKSRAEWVLKEWASNPCERSIVADGYSVAKIPECASVDYGMANWVDELKAIGNGQVPAVAAKAWHVLCQRGRVAAEHYGNLPKL